MMPGKHKNEKLLRFVGDINNLCQMQFVCCHERKKLKKDKKESREICAFFLPFQFLCI